MRYASVLREVLTRFNFHSTLPIPGQSVPLLNGLKVKLAGEWNIIGDEDVPLLTIIDLNAAEQPGRSQGSISMFLSTKREYGFIQIEEASSKIGLIDWMELVMDAVELKPSDGKPDQYLTPHNTDGTVKNIGGAGTLLNTQFSINTKMAQISDLTMTMQIDINFVPVLTARANRRTTPIAPAS